MAVPIADGQERFTEAYGRIQDVVLATQRVRCESRYWQELTREMSGESCLLAKYMLFYSLFH